MAKRLHTSIVGGLLLLASFAFLSGPIIAHAAIPCAPGSVDTGDGSGCQPTSAPAPTAAATAPTAAAAGSSSGGSGIGSQIANFFGGLLQVGVDGLLKPVVLIVFVIFTFCNWILAIAGMLFNWTVIRTVFQYASFFGNSQGLLTAWGILRDIGNIVLLFGFIFMGVSTILNLPHSEFTARRALPALIIFAVLMNFSLFAAETVIDVANGFSSSIATQAGQGCAPNSSASDCANVGISGAIFKMTGLSPIFNFDVLKGSNLHTIPEIVVFLILSLFVIITALVLLAGAIMLIIRAVVLTFLIITSPIGFAGMAVPPLHEMASTWWKQLLNQAFFAPVYILMILISLSIANGLSQGMENNSLISALTVGTNGIGGPGGFQGVLVFALVIGFMLGALLVAKQFGAAGATFAANSASALTFGAVTRGTNLVTGGVAYGARRFQQRTGFGGKTGEVLVNRLARPLEKSNIDLRSAPGVAGALGAVGITAGAKPAEHATFADTQHKYKDAVSGKASKELAETYRNEVLRGQILRGDINTDSERYLKNLTGDQIAADHDLSHAMDHLADQLSPDQFEAYMKSKDASETDKNHARDARYAKLTTQISVSDGASVRKWSKKDLEQYLRAPSFQGMSDADKKEFLSLLSDEQYKGLSESDRLTNTEKVTIQGLRDARFDIGTPAYEYDSATNARKVMQRRDPATGAMVNMDRIDRTLRGMNSSAKAKLDDSTLVKPEVYTRLNPADFEAIRRAEKLTDEQRETIGIHIANVLTDVRHPDHAKYDAYYSSLGPGAKNNLRAFYNLP